MPNEKNFGNKMFQTKLRERSLSFLLFTNRRSFTTILKSIEVGIRHTKLYLTLSWRRYLSHRNQSIDFQNKPMDWFLYDRDHHHDRVNHRHNYLCSFFIYTFGQISIAFNKGNFISWY